jgi:hypothetical protein
MALTSVPNVKAYLGLSGNTEDAKLALMVAEADVALKSELGRDIESTTYPSAATGGHGDSGYYSGTGTPYLLLRQYPVHADSITLLRVDPDGYFGEGTDAFDSTTALTEGTDFVLHLDGCLPGGSTKCSYTGVVEKLGGVWPALVTRQVGEMVGNSRRHRGNIKIAYTAGYATVPADLENAAIQLVAWLRRTADKGGEMQSESLGAYSYSMMIRQGIEQIGGLRRTIAKYRAVSKRIA